MTHAPPDIDKALRDEATSLLHVAIAIIAGAVIDVAVEHIVGDVEAQLIQTRRLRDMGRNIRVLAEASEILTTNS